MLLIRRHRPIGEPPEIDAALARGRRLVRAPVAGTRIAELLERLAADLGPLVAEPATHWLPDLEASPAELATTDAGERFEAVVLASHLVNVPEPELRDALLQVASRHAAGRARVLVEHHPIDWTRTAAESWSDRPDGRLGMIEVRSQPPFVSAVSVYEVGGRSIRQPFTARVLSDQELVAELERAGLLVRRRLSPTWLEAEPAARSPIS